METLTSNASAPEIAWTAFGLLGLSIAIVAFRFWMRVLRQLYDSSLNGRARLQAWSNVLQEGLTLYAQLGATLAGAFQMSQPPSNPATPITPVGVAVTIVVINVELVFTIKSIIRMWVRWRQIEMTKRALERSEDRRPDE